ncbi:MAG: arginine N-succinyltransferase [Deltaproteobacteria bacterium]|nr:arginine N-succinyltransferase [Candidatus Anaeroferrophillus wilburensis]MBN2888041.1 arginine N-succinyltransferase [Deltaproteobacteria bacterium]
MKILAIVVLATSIATIVAVIAVTGIFSREFRPVTLSAGEQQILENKLARLDPGNHPEADHQQKAPPVGQTLQPEPYSEKDARREIVLSEKELNALLARNTDLARKLAIDLADDLVSAKLLLPVEEDFPLLGGKTIKATAGLELATKNGQLTIALKGISIWGVPVPNAWLGNLKNVNLIKEFGNDEGFWKTLAAGIETIIIKEDKLLVKLKE